jgi:magnesium-transporting ATPase (P-type)
MGENHLQNPDPILLQGSLIMAGSGKAVVCAVGKNTLRELELTENELRIEEENTPLSQKLALLGSEIGKWAYLMSFVALVFFMIFWLINSIV